MDIYSEGQKVSIDIETTKENFKSVLELAREVLREPVFPSNEFDKLKQKMLTDIESNRSEPQAIAFNVLQKRMNDYDPADFRYAMNFDEEGAAINKITVDDVKKFYSNFYNGSSATAVIIGDFQKEEALGELNLILQNWTSPEQYTYAIGHNFDAPAKSEKINCPDKANAMMAAGCNLTLKDDNPDFPALIMGNFILGGGFLNSRLATRIRVKEGISYGVGSNLQAGELDSDGGFGSYAIYNPENSDKLIMAYNEEINKLLKEGVTDSELADAKSGFIQSRNRNRSQDDYLINKLTRYIPLSRTMKWDGEQEKVISSLTAAQVNTAMKKWIKPEKIIIVQAGDFEKKKN